MSIKYETTFNNVGGRVGESVAVDKTFKLDQPNEQGMMENGATNPEQLFAAALASCYNGAFLWHMEEAGLKSDVTFNVKVLLEDDPDQEGGLRIHAICSVQASELSEEQIKDLLAKAESTSPYTKIFKGKGVLENQI